MGSSGFSKRTYKHFSVESNLIVDDVVPERNADGTGHVVEGIVEVEEDVAQPTT